MKRLLAILAAALLLCAFSAAAFAADAPAAPAAPAADEGPKVGPNVGNKIPPFKLADPNSKKDVSSEELAKSGKDTVVLFMQTACSLCVSEITEFVSAADDLKGKVNVILISVDYDEKRIPGYMTAYSVPFPIGHDKEAGVLDSLKLGATPATVIFDGKGVIKAKFEGYDKAKVKGLVKEYSK
jgi:peroxiredoxin